MSAAETGVGRTYWPVTVFEPKSVNTACAWALAKRVIVIVRIPNIAFLVFIRVLIIKVFRNSARPTRKRRVVLTPLNRHWYAFNGTLSGTPDAGVPRTVSVCVKLPVLWRTAAENANQFFVFVTYVFLGAIGYCRNSAANARTKRRKMEFKDELIDEKRRALSCGLTRGFSAAPTAWVAIPLRR